MTDLFIQGGGPAATAVVTLSRLGVPTMFIGAVGDDDFGRSIRTGLREEGVDTSGMVTVPRGRSQAAFILVEEHQGARTIYWHRGLGTTIDPDQLNLVPIRRACLLHVDGLNIDASLAAAQEAKQSGIPVAFDAGTLRDGYLDLAPLTDYFICSEKFFEAFQPDNNIESGLARLSALGPRHAVVTMGIKGSRGFDGRRFHDQHAYRIKAVDTTGAGDVYHGAYIYGILAGWPMADCMRFASATAALKCRQPGGRTGIPNLEQALEFMNNAPLIS